MKERLLKNAEKGKIGASSARKGNKEKKRKNKKQQTTLKVSFVMLKTGKKRTIHSRKNHLQGLQ